MPREILEPMNHARFIGLMAPNAAFFSDAGLAKVVVPVLVYAVENDDLTRVQYQANAWRGRWPGEAARDPVGFDRRAFHEVMNREIVGFFDRTLRPAGNTPTTRLLSRGRVDRLREGARCPGSVREPEQDYAAQGYRCVPR